MIFIPKRLLSPGSSDKRPFLLYNADQKSYSLVPRRDPNPPTPVDIHVSTLNS